MKLIATKKFEVEYTSIFCINKLVATLNMVMKITLFPG